MCSTPPARTTSAAPIAISPAPAVTAVSAPAHIRSSAKPGTVCGIPARSATSRPIVNPWSPTCAAKITSPIRSGGSDGFRRSSSRTTFTAMSSARVFQKNPFGPRGRTRFSDRRRRPPRVARAPRGDNSPVGQDWSAHLERQERRYRDGEERLPDDPDERQRQLTRMGNAAGGAGLALLMAGRRTRRPGGSIARPAATARATSSRRPGAGAGRSARSSHESWPATGPAPRRRPRGRSARAQPRRTPRSAATRARASSPSAGTRKPVRSRTRCASEMTSHTTSRTRWRRSPRRTSSATRTRSRASSSRSSNETSTSKTCRSRTR